MIREFILFSSIIVIALFMTIHSNNQKIINESEQQTIEHRINRDNLLMKEGSMIKLGNGVTITKSADLIIFNQSNSTIFLTKDDIQEVIAFIDE
tara:strand:- start:2191 stop:2472 length:282 start_codon:yes stop_codon:yes gene_type:complete